MVQSVKCLTRKHADVSLDPQHPHKTQACWCVHVEMTEERDRQMLANQFRTSEKVIQRSTFNM